MTLTYLSRSQRLTNLGSFNFYCFRIHTFVRTHEDVDQIWRWWSWATFVVIVITISKGNSKRWKQTYVMAEAYNWRICVESPLYFLLHPFDHFVFIYFLIQRRTRRTSLLRLLTHKALRPRKRKPRCHTRNINIWLTYWFFTWDGERTRQILQVRGEPWRANHVYSRV